MSRPIWLPHLAAIKPDRATRATLRRWRRSGGTRSATSRRPRTTDRMHPAAAARAAVRRQRRILAGWYVANRYRVAGGPAFWLDPYTAAVTLKFAPGAPVPDERPAPAVWELDEVERVEHVDQVATVVTVVSGRNSRTARERIRRQERRSVSRPVRGPDTGSVRPESGPGRSREPAVT